MICKICKKEPRRNKYLSTCMKCYHEIRPKLNKKIVRGLVGGFK